MRIPFFLYFLFLIACNQKQSDSQKSADTTEIINPISPEKEDFENNLISCWGVGEIELGDDLASIEEKVGKENVDLDSFFLEGRFEHLISTVWKDSPKEIKIHWNKRKAPYNTIKYIEISQPNSLYTFANGIKIGISLNDMVKLNGEKPINLYGFGWDYGGTFIDFGAGKLKGDLPCFSGVFQLKKNTSESMVELMGDRKISSSHPAFKNNPAELVAIKINNEK